MNRGVATQTVNTRASIQQTITDGIDSARTAQSGVNLDEEMTSLYDTDAKSIIDSLSRDTDPLALLLNSGDFD